jgi:hypothetical protein
LALQSHHQATVNRLKSRHCTSSYVNIFTCYYWMSSLFKNVCPHFTHTISILWHPRCVPSCIVTLVGRISLAVLYSVSEKSRYPGSKQYIVQYCKVEYLHMNTIVTSCVWPTLAHPRLRNLPPPSFLPSLLGPSGELWRWCPPVAGVMKTFFWLTKFPSTFRLRIISGIRKLRNL